MAFLVVIIVAVGTVAVLTGRLTEAAFRRYEISRSDIWDQTTTKLAGYYEQQGSWAGLQGVLESLSERRQHMGEWRNNNPTGGPPPRMIDFRITDTRGQVIADTNGPPRGFVPQAALDNGIPIEVNGETVGYLVPALANPPNWPMDAAQMAFLNRIRHTLFIATLAALGVALVIGGLLFRSITAPLRKLTAATETIAQGDLSARAPVRGQDEVAQLAEAFNQMAESLDRMERARRNQTADIAHELRTPLTVIQGTLEAMLDGVYSTDQENLQAALAQTRTISRLVEDLRLLALADAGRLELHKTHLDPNTFLPEIVEAHRPEAQKQDIELSLEMPNVKLPQILADRDRLAQVIGNLLSNAFRYVPPEGHITVRAAERERDILIAVIDDGPGVPHDDLPHIFKRFWRADPARQRKTGGSGLGLSIARHIVEAHKGDIWADDTPGGGLSVAFSLPIQA